MTFDEKKEGNLEKTADEIMLSKIAFSASFVCGILISYIMLMRSDMLVNTPIWGYLIVIAMLFAGGLFFGFITYIALAFLSNSNIVKINSRKVMLLLVFSVTVALLLYYSL